MNRSGPLQRPASQSATYSLPETITFEPYFFQQMTGPTRIPTIGVKLLSRIARCGTKTSTLIVVYRLFSDDALHIQPYVHTDDLHTEWTNVNFPRLTLDDPESCLKRAKEESEERSEWSWIWQAQSLAQCMLSLLR